MTGDRWHLHVPAVCDGADTQDQQAGGQELGGEGEEEDEEDEEDRGVGEIWGHLSESV